ncbi:MAG: hypothetical protein NUK65_04435 [Firmicutes bacterium]|nr:hypothetical protein [Bacillota bacterium]
MIINWYTVMFQVINFLVLVFLLRRFLYGPIVNMMEEREEIIYKREEVAAAKKEKAELEAHNYRQKVELLQARDQKMLEEARADAEKERMSLLESTRLEVDETHKRWHKAMQREQETFLHDLRNRVGRQATLIAKQCLRDLADATLEEMVWHVFQQKVEQLPPAEQTRLQNAFTQEESIILRSALEPAPERLQELTTYLHAFFSQPVQVMYENSPELICGLELEVGGYRVAWHVEGYLKDVEKQILGNLSTTSKEEVMDVQAES